MYLCIVETVEGQLSQPHKKLHNVRAICASMITGLLQTGLRQNHLLRHSISQSLLTWRN